jgi:hypothetical protein
MADVVESYELRLAARGKPLGGFSIGATRLRPQGANRPKRRGKSMGLKALSQALSMRGVKWIGVAGRRWPRFNLRDRDHIVGVTNMIAKESRRYQLPARSLCISNAELGGIGILDGGEA